ncbi:MAG: hypothetical protein HYU68_01035 [Bacteroidetes bacterium]|nr:hypothetical protein [Bacteroidota bacterium]
MKNIFLLLVILFLISCKTPETTSTPLKVKDPNSPYTTCVLVEKEFVNKGGYATDYKELYLQCSVQDYFIKICESNVTLEELKSYINSSIKIKMEIKDGRWDICSGDPAYAQSRIGTYVVIKEIVK